MSSSAKHRSNRESPADSLKGRHSLSAGAIFCGCLAASISLRPSLAPAQEALRNSLAGDAAAAANRLQLESIPYTFKTGDLRLLFTPTLGFEWNDNINISQTKIQEDLIVSPGMQLMVNYPISQQNILSLNVGISYDKYLDHDQYSTWQLQSGSALSFDIFIKDFRINVHDRVGYAKDSAQQAAVAGTASFGNINNTIGLNVTWDLADVTLTAGYDHENVISGTSQFNSQNRAAELIMGRAGVRVHPKVITGVEASGSFTRYEQMVLNDNAVYSVGVYADFQPGKYFQIQPRVGYSISQFKHTSQSIQTSDLGSWYADLNVTHQVTDAVSYSLAAGHEVSPGIQSDAIEDWYFRPSITWNIIKNLSLTTSFSYQHGNQGAGNVAGNLKETYDWYTAGLGVSYPIIKKLTLSLNYRLTVRSASDPTRGYTQNMLGLQLSYHPQ